MQSNEVVPSTPILSFGDWVKMCGFKTPSETAQYSPYEERRWLQFSIYPMFYNVDWSAYKVYEFPKVLKTAGHYPKYVIDTKYFTIVFLMHIVNGECNRCWEVSVHIKDHDFCDEKLKSFQSWFFRYYHNMSAITNSVRPDMPKEFLYKDICDINQDEPMEDFYVQFWDEDRNNLLFKLFDILRLD